MQVTNRFYLCLNNMHIKALQYVYDLISRQSDLVS